MMLRLLLVMLCALVCVGCKTAEPPTKKVVAPVAVKKTPAPVQKKPERPVLATYYGLASWYSVKTNHGTKTASGRPFVNSAYTAAHKKLPFGTKVRVTCAFNGRSEILTITDRGPYVKGRIIDVSVGSAKRLGFFSRGITKVKVEVLEYGNWKYRHP